MDSTYREYKYESWKKKQFTSKEGFFPIYQSFEDKMAKLSGGAVSLYVFLGLKSNYKKGTSFYSINKLSIIFGKSSRTISIWIKELENEELIYREQKALNSVSTTYLLPYGLNK